MSSRNFGRGMSLRNHSASASPDSTAKSVAGPESSYHFKRSRYPTSLLGICCTAQSMRVLRVQSSIGWRASQLQYPVTQLTPDSVPRSASYGVRREAPSTREHGQVERRECRNHERHGVHTRE